MNPAAANTSESSLLLWVLAAAVGMLAAHVCLGWVRDSQRHPEWRASWRGVLLASCALGTGVSSAMVLALSAEALAFPLGYPLPRVLMLWGLAMLGSVPGCYWMIRSQGLVALLGGGTLLTALAASVQAGWVWAVGFRPGVVWHTEFVVIAVGFMLLGIITAMWVAFSEAAQSGRRRHLWRLGGAMLFGLTLMAGQEVLMAGAGLLAQVGSVYQREVSGALLSLVAGVLVPLVLSMQVLGLELRRRSRRHRGREGSDSLQLQRRAKKRHRVRSI